MTKVPSSSSTALDDPAHQPTPSPGAGTATTASPDPGSGKLMAGLLAGRCYREPRLRARRGETSSTKRVDSAKRPPGPSTILNSTTSPATGPSGGSATKPVPST